MYTVVYTPENELAGNTVIADNFTLAGDDTVAEVKESYYYPANNQVRLLALVDTADINTPLNLKSVNVKDTEGNNADVDTTVYLLSEENIEVGALAIQSYRFISGGAAVSDVTNKTGISILVCVANATTGAKRGTVTVYDGTTVCGEAEFNVKNEGVVWLTVDTTSHTFTADENVRVVIE